MAEPVYDKLTPGGLHMILGRVVDARGVPLDEPPGAPSIGVVPGVDDDAKAKAEAAESARIAAFYAPVIADATSTAVAALADYLATVTDPRAVEAAAAADTRVTAGPLYLARLSELGVAAEQGDAGGSDVPVSEPPAAAPAAAPADAPADDPGA